MFTIIEATILQTFHLLFPILTVFVSVVQGVHQGWDEPSAPHQRAKRDQASIILQYYQGKKTFC